MSACVPGVFERLCIARRVWQDADARRIRRSQPYPGFLDHWRQVPHHWSTTRQGLESLLDMCCSAMDRSLSTRIVTN